MKKALLAALLVACVHALVRAQIVPGRNFNVNPGMLDEFVGDRFLQRQVEPKIVCASNNTQLCLAIANDYRTVDQTADPDSGFGEALLRRLFGAKTESRLAALPDAWLGLYRSSNGARNWQNGLVPGSLIDTSPLSGHQPWYGLAAASDGALTSDGVHFYGAGLFFNRGGTSLIGAFRLTAYNDESAFPIRWDHGFSRAIDQGAATSSGKFADLPTIAADPPRTGDASCGNVYLAYTRFSGGGSSSIYFSRSSNCGATYLAPKKISGTVKITQRAVIAVDPRPGTPTTTGGGTVYIVFRGFKPNIIAFVKSTDYGATWSSPVPITTLSGPANLCVYDQPTVGVEAGDPNAETARALAFASAQVDSAGRIHVVWTERVDPATGLPLSGAACTTAYQPRIVYTRSVSGGVTWTARRAIDTGVRCETRPTLFQAAGLDRSSPNGSGCSAGTTMRPSGPQIQPALAHNAGKLMLLYSEGRANPATGDFLDATGYHTGRNTQTDIRAAQIDPASGALLSTTQVSQYAIDAFTNDIAKVNDAKDPAEAKAYNRAYLPQYKGGTVSFKGDHDDLIPIETFVFGSPARFATADDVPSAKFLGVWGGDNREAMFPGGSLFSNEWWKYVDPGSGGASACNAGIRNSNNYVAYVGSVIEAFVHQSFKPPFAFAAGNRDRTWAVTVRNRSNTPRILKYVLEEKAGAGDASFDQFRDVNVIGNSGQTPFCGPADYPVCTAYRIIQPQSSMTFTVFGEVTDSSVAAPFKINVHEATLSSGQPPTITAETLSAVVRLNPSPTNPAPLAGNEILIKEHHGPSVQGPFVRTYQNPTQGNPTQGNPTQGNPTQGNPTQGNPTQGNPTQGNAGFADYTDYEFRVRTAEDVNTLSQYSAFVNIASADEVDESHLVQMIITRRHMVPTLTASGVDAPGCQPTERIEDEVISIITVPKAGHLGVPTQGNPTQGNPTQGNPTQGNPTQGNPTQGNPTQGNPTQGNNTFALSPRTLTAVGAQTSAQYRATALATAAARAVADAASSIAPDGTLVGSPLTDEIIVNFRFFHCTVAGSCGVRADGTAFQAETLQTETVPRTCATDPCGPTDAASNLAGFVVIAGAGDNDNGTVSPPRFAGAGPDLAPGAAPTLTPSTVVAGDVIQPGPFSLQNNGTATSAPSSYRFLAVPSSGPAVSLSAGQPIGSIAAGVPLAITEPPSLSTHGLEPGTYIVGPFVDDGDVVAESDEFNNFTGTMLVVVPPPAITTESLPDATAGVAYSATPTATGGVGAPPYAWSLASGALPPGLTLNSSTGNVSGTPLNGGHTYSFTLEAADAASPPHAATRALTIRVAGASVVVLDTDVVTAGVGGMRVETADHGEPHGTGGGTISVTGVSGTVTKALLYWNGPTKSHDPAVNRSVAVNGLVVTGQNIGFASPNCWELPGFTNSQSYRADVTSIVQAAGGNGSYVLSNFAKEGVADVNGASLIVFFNDNLNSNNRDVYIADGNDSDRASAFEAAGWDSSVHGINYPGGPWTLYLHITDGQSGSDGAWSLNGTQIEAAGQNFQGNSVPGAGSSFPGWDIRSFPFNHGVLLTPGAINSLRLTNQPGGDCIGAVVVMVSVSRPFVDPPEN